MTKGKNTNLLPWVIRLRNCMERQGLNPRSLSIRAGLNATAVRDIMQERSRFPRYDTLQALADVLGTTPASLMTGDGECVSMQPTRDSTDEYIEKLSAIIDCLQDVAAEMKRELSVRVR